MKASCTETSCKLRNPAVPIANTTLEDNTLKFEILQGCEMSKMTKASIHFHMTC